MRRNGRKKEEERTNLQRLPYSARRRNRQHRSVGSGEERVGKRDRLTHPSGRDLRKELLLIALSSLDEEHRDGRILGELRGRDGTSAKRVLVSALSEAAERGGGTNPRREHTSSRTACVSREISSVVVRKRRRGKRRTTADDKVVHLPSLFDLSGTH